MSSTKPEKPFNPPKGPRGMIAKRPEPLSPFQDKVNKKLQGLGLQLPWEVEYILYKHRYHAHLNTWHAKSWLVIPELDFKKSFISKDYRTQFAARDQTMRIIWEYMQGEEFKELLKCLAMDKWLKDTIEKL